MISADELKMLTHGIGTGEHLVISDIWNYNLLHSLLTLLWLVGPH